MIDVANIRYLCFGVGGANGWVFVGILMALESALMQQQTSLAHQIRGVAGASIGSVMALAVVLNFGAIELCELLKRCTHKYKDVVRRVNVFDIMSKKGIMSTDVIRCVVGDMIAQKLGDGCRDITMAELHARSGKDYVLTTHNVTRMRGEYIDRHTHGNLPVWKAISMSCAIPGIFHAVEHHGSLYVDAGISNGLPFECFPLEESLVFHLSSHHEFLQADIMSVQEFFCRLTHAFDTTLFHKLDAVPKHLRHRILTLEVPCLIQSALDGFVLSDADRDRLIHAGLTAGQMLVHYQLALVSQAAVLYLSCTRGISSQQPPAAVPEELDVVK